MNVESRLKNHYPPCASRVHEACGAGAYAFVADLCALQQDAIIWVYHGRELTLHHDGLAPFGRIEKIHFLNVADAKAQAWCMETALNSASVGLVICEREKPISFRDMRRLQLAAERGQTTGVIITLERFASPVAETRWQCEPVYDARDPLAARPLQRWSLVKNKQGALGEWEVRWNEENHRFALV